MFLMLLFTLLITSQSNSSEYLHLVNQKPVIWLYWENGNGEKKPLHIEVCEKSVIKNCESDFSIIVLDEKSIYHWIKDLHPNWKKLKSIAQKSDYVRLKVLEEYGGIWLDSDWLVFSNIKEVLDLLDEFDTIFTSFEDKNYISNGFIASRKNNKLIKRAIKESEFKLEHELNSDEWVTTELGSKILHPLYINSIFYNTNSYIIPDDFFYPFTWRKIEDIVEDFEGEFDPFNSKMIHLYNHYHKQNLSTILIENKNSMFSKMIDHIFK